MGAAASIGRGFRLVHRNWELVAVQAVLSFMGLVLFAVMVGIPVGAVTPAGDEGPWDLIGPEGPLAVLKDPARLLAGYAGLVLVLAATLLLYLTVWLLLWTYVLGGSTGVLADDLVSGRRFSLRGFIGHAARLFGPLMSYLSLVGLVILAGGLLAAGSGAAAALVLGALDPQGLLGRVLAVALAGGFSAVVFFLLSAASAVGLAPLVMEGHRARAALDRGARHLLSTPSALVLVAVLAAGYLGAYGVLSAGAFVVAQAAGNIAVLAYQFFASVVVGYVGLVGLASILSAWDSASAGGSIRNSCTSAPRPLGYGPPPAGSSPLG